MQKRKEKLKVMIKNKEKLDGEIVDRKKKNLDEGLDS